MLTYAMPINFPEDFFDPPTQRPADWSDDPDLRRGLDWLKSFMAEAEWKARRRAVAERLYDTALQRITDPSDKGRFFPESDVIGWYLFLGEAFLDHAGNYDPMFGARVVPILHAIGSNLTLLQGVTGLGTRVRRLIGADKRQPNGGLFELLVAAAYRRAGAEVAFRGEQPGRTRTHDMDVRLDGRTWAVECKRMETSEYGERERLRMRELWGPSAAWLSRAERNVFCDVHLAIEVGHVPPHYLTSKVKQWLSSSLPSLLWKDEVGYGAVGDLDLEPLRSVLATDIVLATGSRMLELLSGRYDRFPSCIQVMRMKFAQNPRYVEDCDLAILLRWECIAPASIDRKARDVFAKVAEANDQLPEGTPGIVHIGFEAVDGDIVEQARYEKILTSAQRFDPGSKRLEYIYCHYFVPESPSDQVFAFDETTQWCSIRPTSPRPLEKGFLLMPKAAIDRDGTHWQS